MEDERVTTLTHDQERLVRIVTQAALADANHGCWWDLIEKSKGCREENDHETVLNFVKLLNKIRRRNPPKPSRA